MFIQNYIHQAATAIMLSHTSPDKLQIPGEKAAPINRDAILYGNLELRMRARRYLRFAMPCMAHDMWARGLKKDRPTYDMVEKKTSELGLFLNKLCYNNRDVQDDVPENIIAACWNSREMTAAEAQKLAKLSKPPMISTASTRNIPFFDDGHGYNFFRDNTPYDASCDVLLTMAQKAAEQDKNRAVVLPDAAQLFGHDDYFVIDRFSQYPNDCLGPDSDGSIIKKIQLMVGPDFVQDVAYTSIKDLREMDLWKPTEFDQLMLVSGTSLAGAIKNAFTGITAPMALYWSWVEKVQSIDVPMTEWRWVHKELSDRITEGEIFTLATDKATLKWLRNNGIVKLLEESPEDFYMFPNYDRNRYASRPMDERKMSLDEWAWSPAHATKIPRGNGVKVRGLAHPAYVASFDTVSERAVVKGSGRERPATINPQIAEYGRMSAIAGRARDGLSAKAKEFLQWATETASADYLISALGKEAEPGDAPSSKVPGFTPEKKDTPALTPEKKEPKEEKPGATRTMNLGFTPKPATKEEDEKDAPKPASSEVKQEKAPTPSNVTQMKLS